MRIREGHLVGESGPSTPAGAPSRFRSAALGYLALMKPRVIELLLVTTIPAMLLAHRGHADLVLILNTLFGGLLAAGGANTLNCVADADIDKVMKPDRAPAAGPGDGAARPCPLIFGLALSVGSFSGSGGPQICSRPTWRRPRSRFTCWSTRWCSKRRTSQNVVWAGRPAACP